MVRLTLGSIMKTIRSTSGSNRSIPAVALDTSCRYPGKRSSALFPEACAPGERRCRSLKLKASATVCVAPFAPTFSSSETYSRSFVCVASVAVVHINSETDRCIRAIRHARHNASTPALTLRLVRLFLLTVFVLIALAQYVFA
eukprot:2270368-Prymnesium_polylepis.1